MKILVSPLACRSAPTTPACARWWCRPPRYGRRVPWSPQSPLAWPPAPRTTRCASGARPGSRSSPAEGARTHMQGDAGALHASGCQCRSSASSKCRAAVGAAAAPGFWRIRSGSGARPRRIGMGNVGGSGTWPCVPSGHGVVARVIGQHKANSGPSASGQRPSKVALRARGCRARRPGPAWCLLRVFCSRAYGPPPGCRQHALDQQFQLAAGGFFAEQARLDHLVSLNTAVAALSKPGRSRKMRSTAGCRCRRAGGSRCARGRVLGDQLRRQLEIKIAESEDAAGVGIGSGHALEGRTDPFQVVLKGKTGQNCPMPASRQNLP